MLIISASIDATESEVFEFVVASFILFFYKHGISCVCNCPVLRILLYYIILFDDVFAGI